MWVCGGGCVCGCGKVGVGVCMENLSNQLFSVIVVWSAKQIGWCNGGTFSIVSSHATMTALF